MQGRMSLLSKGRFDEIDILSGGEMNNILGGSSVNCVIVFCKKNYAEQALGEIILCGCGYQMFKSDQDEKPDDNSKPVDLP